MNKYKILFLSANPRDTAMLSLDEEIREITQKIRFSDGRDNLELISSWAVRPDDLLQYFNQYRPHIVHFSGHGSEVGQLVLTDDQGRSKPVSPEALRALFSALKDDIKLVFLNACYSNTQAEAINATIDYVIGMRRSITDKAAIIFASAFYRALGFGRSFQESFSQAKTALLLEDIPEEDIPQLLVRKGIPDEKADSEALPSADADLIRQIRKVFDRPAFRVTCAEELHIDELSQAFDDVQAALNTGRLYSRDGKLLGEIPDRHQFVSKYSREVIEKILKLLTEAKRIDESNKLWFYAFSNEELEDYIWSKDAPLKLKKPLIIDGSRAKRGNPPDAWDQAMRRCDEVDEIRNRILHEFNKLLVQIGEDPLPMIISSSILHEARPGWIGVSTGRTESLLTKGRSEYEKLPPRENKVQT